MRSQEALRSSLFSLSLHDALPISAAAFLLGVVALREHGAEGTRNFDADARKQERDARARVTQKVEDRKSTRLNSSHLGMSYAVLCLQKKMRADYPALLPNGIRLRR